MTTVAVYLEDHAGDDGGLSIAPGSHRNASVHQETVAALDPSARPGGKTRDFKKTTPECRKDQKRPSFPSSSVGAVASSPRRRRDAAANSPPRRRLFALGIYPRGAATRDLGIYARHPAAGPRDPPS